MSAGVEPGIRERGLDGRREDFGDRGLAHEALFIGVGLGMLARGVDVDEIMRKACPTDQARRRRRRRPRPPRRRRLGERCRALPACPGAARPPRSAYRLRPSRASSSAETAQRREPETSCARVAGGSASASISKPACDLSKNGADVDAKITASGSRRSAARGLDRQRHRVLVPARDRARAGGAPGKARKSRALWRRRRDRAAAAAHRRRRSPRPRPRASRVSLAFKFPPSISIGGT